MFGLILNIFQLHILGSWKIWAYRWDLFWNSKWDTSLGSFAQPDTYACVQEMLKRSFVASCWCGLCKESWLTFLSKDWRYFRRRRWRQGEELRVKWHAFIVPEYGCVNVCARGCELIMLNVNRHTMREKSPDWGRDAERERAEIYPSESMKKKMSECWRGRDRGWEDGWTHLNWWNAEIQL